VFISDSMPNETHQIITNLPPKKWNQTYFQEFSIWTLQVKKSDDTWIDLTQNRDSDPPLAPISGVIWPKYIPIKYNKPNVLQPVSIAVQ